MRNQNFDHLRGARERVIATLHEAGWPQAVGLDDKQKTSHNKLTLEGRTVHTYWTRGSGFFVFDPVSRTVARAEKLESALLKALEMRASCDSGMTGGV